MIKIVETEEYENWLRKLHDRKARSRILIRVRRLSVGNSGDARTWVPVNIWRARTMRPPIWKRFSRDGDPRVIAAALGGGDVARWRGMSSVAARADLGRESLCKALSQNGDQGLATVINVLETLDMRLLPLMKNGEAAVGGPDHDTGRGISGRSAAVGLCEIEWQDSTAAACIVSCAHVRPVRGLSVSGDALRGDRLSPKKPSSVL